MSDAVLDPWCVVEIGDDEHLFGYAERHSATGGRAWTRSSPIVDLDEARGRARTLSGRSYTLGKKVEPEGIEDEEAQAALRLLTGRPGALSTGDAAIAGWLTSRKMARHLGIEPPAREHAAVAAFLSVHSNVYLRALGRMPPLN